MKKRRQNFADKKKAVSLQPQNGNGAIAQLVEQRTENPCVAGSIPAGTTQNGSKINDFEPF